MISTIIFLDKLLRCKIIKIRKILAIFREKKTEIFIAKMDRSWLVQKSKSKNSKNLWKIDEISRILAIFHFLKNINRCSLNRLQFWLDPILQKHSKKFIKIPKIFGIFREKKNRKFLLQKWIVHSWYKNQKNVESTGNFEPFWP